MQEEIEKECLSMTFRAAKFTGETFTRAIRETLNIGFRLARDKMPHGEVSMRKLMERGEGAKTIEIADQSIDLFREVARKYHVDFSIQKDSTEDPPKYIVFFHGKDADVIKQCFKEYVFLNEKQNEQKRESLKKRLAEAKKKIAKQTKDTRDKTRIRVRENVR